MNNSVIDTQINTRIAELFQTANDLPGVVIIHDFKGTVIWMSKRGLEELGISLSEVAKLSSAEYYSKFFNEDDAKDYVPKILGLLERNNDDEICTYFQQVRFAGHTEWRWHMSSTKIWVRDETGVPLLTITISFPVDSMHHMTAKATKLLEENNFLRGNFYKYVSLSQRERDVLRLLALGKSTAETSKELFIAITTVETHRKNIRKKLSTSTYYELCLYARAFDLI